MKEEAKRSKTLRKFWKAKLQEWQASDLTAPGWCRANQLPYHQFIYWKKTLLPPEPSSNQIPITPDCFVEMTEHQTSKNISTEIKVTWHHVTIHLEESFNKKALKSLLEVMKELEAC